MQLKRVAFRVNYSCWLFSVQAGFDLWHVLQYHLLFFFIAELGIFSQAGWYHSWPLLHSIYFLPSSAYGNCKTPSLHTLPSFHLE